MYDPTTGQETGVSTPNTAIQYSYDQAGELTSVTTTRLDGQTLAAPLVTSYQYDPNGRLISTQNANGTTEARTYNAVGELTAIVDSNGGGQYASFKYTYDPAGHILTETDLGGRTDTYTYDAEGRLLTQVIAVPNGVTRTLTWSYDLVGNRVISTDTGAPTGQQMLESTYNANDELTTIAGYELSNGQWVMSGYSQSYEYDNNGDTTSVTTGSTTATSTWDALGHMTGYNSGTGTVASYTYDPAGNRTSESVTVNNSTTTTTYLNDPNQAYDQVLEEYAQNGNLEASYIHGIAMLFQQRIQSGTGTLSFYATDNLGSTRALTNSDGTVTETYTYDAYGNLIGQTWTGTTATPNEFLFTGQQFDAAIGQYYQRARYYDASAGRFTSRDSYGGQTADPITENRYIYANADPNDTVDPSGHMSLGSMIITIGIGATLTGIVAAPYFTTVSKPPIWAEFVPVLGNAWAAAYNLQEGNYGWATFYSVLAATDWFLVKSLLTSVGTLLARVGALGTAELATKVTISSSAPWVSRIGGLRLLQQGGYFIKEVSPEATGFGKWFAQTTLEAQALALKALGDMAPEFYYANGRLIMQDVGQFSGGMLQFLKARMIGSWRMGELLNDILPRNMGAAGLIFDPVYPPLMTLVLDIGIFLLYREATVGLLNAYE